MNGTQNAPGDTLLKHFTAFYILNLDLFSIKIHSPFVVHACSLVWSEHAFSIVSLSLLLYIL